MRALPVLAICSLAGIVCAVAVGATADEPAPSESEASIRRGVELRREGRNGEALVEFQKGFALDPTPRARAQIGLALQALGDWLGAEGWLQDALNAHDDAWITRYETDLRAALATVRAHLGSLSLHVDAQEGEVLVNGAPATALPSSGPIRVVAGSVDVIVRVPGHADVHRVVQVAAGAATNEDVAAGPALVQPALVVASSSPSAPPVDAPSHPHSRVGAYLALGSAAALAIGGVVAWTVRQNAVGIWNDRTRCLQPGAGTRQSQCGVYRDTANVAEGIEIGAFSLAAVSAGAGAWLLWRPGHSSTAAAAWCAPGALTVTCGAAF
jgi:hypothetical protein